MGRNAAMGYVLLRVGFSLDGSAVALPTRSTQAATCQKVNPCAVLGPSPYLQLHRVIVRIKSVAKAYLLPIMPQAGHCPAT